MPYATIDRPSNNFRIKLYTGNGSTQTITFDESTNMQPDWVWTKGRTGTYGVSNHKVYDVIRGATKTLFVNLTNAETTQTNTLTSFNTNGFSLGDDTNINASSTTFASWNWLAGGTGVSNTSGTISSTVSANTTSGFSIVSYTGTGANATVGHGLGVAPRMIILKSRTDSGADWRVYHASVGNTGYLELNTTGATTTSSTTWQNTTPTSSVFSIGTSGTVNLNTGNFIAYCFAEVKGYSKFGSYTGNGSADGTFVYTGFKPAFIMAREYERASSWAIVDNKRNTYNLAGLGLIANGTGAELTPESSGYPVDFLSNGFKWRQLGQPNASGYKSIYMAFAESPFVSSKGLPCTAR